MLPIPARLRLAARVPRLARASALPPIDCHRLSTLRTPLDIRQNYRAATENIAEREPSYATAFPGAKQVPTTDCRLSGASPGRGSEGQCLPRLLEVSRAFSDISHRRIASSMRAGLICCARRTSLRTASRFNFVKLSAGRSSAVPWWQTLSAQAMPHFIPRRGKDTIVDFGDSLDRIEITGSPSGPGIGANAGKSA